ncbi:hypothetical protein DPM19_30330 [Actinomadura craniellae]|uniref:Uncharacterized protein n=1 Tax=Actinomadura craniellae TaxID=2231787 RepID=A0A365GWX3_9ACTN|nr:hypothetical protein [Actinomadura craniellae]RAY11325.1 hypothetical protein DPM19_30330 [Actinomadura craniellae]
MSRDLVTLTPRRPDVVAAVAELRLPAATLDGAVQVLDASGRLLVAAAAPRYVRVPGEAERLLGVPVNVPVWWVELRAAGDLPDARHQARGLADLLVRRYGGSVWPAA